MALHEAGEHDLMTAGHAVPIPVPNGTPFQPVVAYGEAIEQRMPVAEELTHGR